MRALIIMGITRPLVELAQRPVKAFFTRGIAETGLHPLTMFKMYKLAIKRWKTNPNDYFTSLQPDGIEVKVSNGNEIIDIALISDFPGLNEKVYVIVDDCGSEGLVVMILLPDEY